MSPVPSFLETGGKLLLGAVALFWGGFYVCFETPRPRRHSIQRTDSVDYDLVYRYYKGWGLKQVQYPSDRWIRCSSDVDDHLVTIERLTSGEALDKTYWSSVQYAPQGAPKKITLGLSARADTGFAGTLCEGRIVCLPKLPITILLKSRP